VNELDKRVLEQIKERGLSPRPYAYFFAKRSVFWTLAAVSILLGAVSVAALIFAAGDYLSTGGRGFDEMPLDDVFKYLPLIWTGLLALFVASAYFTVRQTPRAYRVSPLSHLTSVLVLSAALGGLLHMAGAGRRAHEFLVSHLPSYERVTRPADKAAANPDKGWLAGTALTFDGKSSLTLRDFKGETWTVDTAGAKLSLDEPLGSEEDISIKGTRTGADTFKATSIEDWD
jgi:hypothetical protein